MPIPRILIDMGFGDAAFGQDIHEVEFIAKRAGRRVNGSTRSMLTCSQFLAHLRAKTVSPL